MISKRLCSLFFGIIIMQAMGTPLTLTEKIDPALDIISILKQNDIDQAYKVINHIRKQKPSLQPQIYHEILTWCLQNKKADLAIALVKTIPSSIFIQQVSPSISLGQSLLKDVIILQITPLLSELVKKIPLSYLKKYLAYKDLSGHTLIDYAQQTSNQEIISIINLKTMRTERSIFSSIIRGIASFIVVVFVIPIILYATLGLALIIPNGIHSVVVLVYGFPILFPPTILASVLCFTSPTLKKFGLKPFEFSNL